jgi:hypothetical protein
MVAPPPQKRAASSEVQSKSSFFMTLVLVVSEYIFAAMAISLLTGASRFGTKCHCQAQVKVFLLWCKVLSKKMSSKKLLGLAHQLL